MPTDRQVQQIAIQTGVYDGGVFTPSGDAVLYDIWNFDGRWRTDWRGGIGNTRSLSGFDISGRGGYRLDLRINLRNTSTAQTTAIQSLLNDIFDNPVFPKAVKISPDEDIANGTVCNIRAGMMGVRREFTINRPVISMDFSGVERSATIPDTFQILGDGDNPLEGMYLLYEGWPTFEGGTFPSPTFTFNSDFGNLSYTGTERTGDEGFELEDINFTEAYLDENMFCMLYFDMENLLSNDGSIPPQHPDVWTQTEGGENTAVEVLSSADSVLKVAYKTQDGEIYTFINPELEINYINLFANLNWDNGNAFMYQQLNPIQNGGSNLDGAGVSVATYKHNVDEIIRFTKDFVAGKITSIQCYYKIG